MRTPLTPLAALAVFMAAACEPPRSPRAGGISTVNPDPAERKVLSLAHLGAHVEAAMGTEEERAARAPYSPEGWPLERGDVVSFDRSWELDHEFPGWNGIHNVFWVGATAFGARWLVHVPSWTDRHWAAPERYIGHFPEKTNWSEWWEDIPEHLRDVNPVELQAALFDPAGGRTKWKNIKALEAEWTEDAWIRGYTGEDGGER